MALSERERVTMPQLYFSDTGLPLEYPVWTAVKEELRAGEQLPITSERTTKPVEVFSSVKQIVKPVANYLHRVHDRGNLEGLEAAFAIDGFTAPFIPIIHPLLTAAIYAGEKIISPELTAVVAVALIAKQIPKSLKSDAEALRSEHFDASAVGTIMYPFTGNSMFTAIAEQSINIFSVGTVSPASLIIGATGDFNIYPASIAAAAIMMPAWYNFVNSAIARGELDEVLEPLKKKREAFVERIKNKIKK
jgi:hypothetical protein